MAEPRRFQAGAPIYGIGADGLAWRVERGSVRLDTAGTPGEACFASLAIPGDLVALRGGQALDRVVGLICLMAGTMGDNTLAKEAGVAGRQSRIRAG